MKKIMFTLLAACAICVTAQASSVDWQFTTRSTSTGVTGGTAYLILGAAGTYATADDVIAAAVDSATITASGNKLITGQQTWDGGTAAAGTSGSFSIVLVDSAKSSFYVAGTGLTGNYYDPDDALTPRPSAINNSVSTAITSANMTSFSGGSDPGGAPEPTSGLLLLVGAGILGLRRKRA